MTRRNAVLLTWSALVALAAGCSDDPTAGYTMKPPFDPRYETVAVPIWKRGAGVYRRGLEMTLTESIQKRIAAYTPMRVVTPPKAQTLLEGTIEIVEITPLSFNPDSGLPREFAINMLVSFVWKDLATGREILRRDRFNTAATYLSAAPFNEDFFVGSRDVMDRIAERIVSQMEMPWWRTQTQPAGE